MAGGGEELAEAEAEAMERHLLALLGAGGSAEPPRDFCSRAVSIAATEGRGRGLVLADSVPAGSLLLACRPLALAPREKLCAKLLERLRRCPEAEYERFLCLYHGGNSGERAVPETVDMEGRGSCERPTESLASGRSVDAKRAERVLRFNAIARDSLNEHGVAEEAESSGLWLMPSFLNHSCRPNVQVTFRDEWLICRSACALGRGEELRVAYVSTFQPAHLRRERLLEDFGFECRCERCAIEDALLPKELARPMLQKLDDLVESIDGRSVKETAAAFERLVARGAQLAQNGVKAASARWQQEPALRAACEGLWGRELAERGCEGGSILAYRLQQLLSGSFLPAFFGAAFAFGQLEDPGSCVECYRMCLELLEEVFAGSAYQAHWAAEWALQMHRAGRSEVAAAAQCARRLIEACHGRGAFDLLVKRHGWPKELLIEAYREARDDEVGEVAAKDAWGCRVEEAGGSLLVSFAVPEDVAPGDVDLDVAPERLEVSCKQAASLPLLRLPLPKRVDPSRAPPAKFKKKGRRLVLELPME